MTIHITLYGVLIAWFVLSGAIVFYRGATGAVVTYNWLDALVGVAEVAFIIWALGQVAS